MDEKQNLPDDEWVEAPAVGSEWGQTRFGGVPWQVFSIGLGLFLLIASIAYFATGRRLFASAVERPPEFAFENIDTSTFIEASVGEPQFVNPLLAQSETDKALASLVFSGLTRLDEFGQPVPDLAESWTVSEDGLTYIFTLRQNATWHDGTPVTANDVAFTMSLLRSSDFPGDPALNTFWRSVETYADDDYTVRFILTQPLSAFPEHAGIGIVPELWLRGIEPADLPNDAFNLDPIGTGRLNWLSIQSDGAVDIVSLEPYPDFYDESRAVSFDVELQFYSSSEQAFRALGPDAQALAGLNREQYQLVLQSADINTYNTRYPSHTMIVFNQQNSSVSFFEERAVRVALANSLDRTLMKPKEINNLLAAYSPVLTGTWAYNNGLQPEYNPQAAAESLSLAGYALQGETRSRGGQELAFELLVTGEDNEVVAESLVGQWSQIGVGVTVRNVNSERLVERVTSGDFEAALVTFDSGRIADPDLYPVWHESQIENGQNFSGFVDRDISQLLETARREPNGVRRTELYQQFQLLFLERAPAIILYNPVYHYAVSCQVEGVQIKLLRGPEDRFNTIHNWQLRNDPSCD